MKKQYKVKKLLVASTVGLLTTTISTVALAWKSSDRHAERIVDYVTEEVDLNTEQQESLKDIAKAFFDARKQIHEENEDNESQRESEAKAFWSKENLQAEDIINYINTRQAQRAENMTKAFGTVADKFVEFHSSLDEKQRAELADLMAEKMGRFGGRHHGKKGKW